MPDSSDNATLDPTGWTLGTLLHHIRSLFDERDRRYMESDRRYQERFEQQERAVQSALTAQKEAVLAAQASAKEAVLKSEAASDRRFESQNEVRQQLTDQARTFMPRLEAESEFQSLNARIAKMETAHVGDLGRGAGMVQLIPWILTALAVLAAVYLGGRP